VLFARDCPLHQADATLYIRNIGDLSVFQQILIARFLIQQEANGKSRNRVIASTVGSLIDLVGQSAHGGLIESLAGNLSAFRSCRIPPLRERLDEIPSLVSSFLDDLRKSAKTACEEVGEDSLKHLLTRRWSGNVRELKFLVENAALNSTGNTLKMPASVSDEFNLMAEMSRTIEGGDRLSLDQFLEVVEKSIIERALLKHDFDLRKAARVLEMTEPNIRYRLKKFNIRVPSQRD
jgi:DNA-binding NtrC family response regulator